MKKNYVAKFDKNTSWSDQYDKSDPLFLTGNVGIIWRHNT
jgi:hypothetical protein